MSRLTTRARTAACLIVLTTSPGARGEQHAVRHGVYGSIDGAVKSLSKCFYRRSRTEDTEYTASIVAGPDGYHVTVEASEPGLDVGWMTIRLHRDQTLAAIWHNHGARGFGRAQFSATDVALARRLAIPVYLTTPQGHLARYDPPAADHGRPSVATPGRRLGHVKGADFVCGTTLAATTDYVGAGG